MITCKFEDGSDAALRHVSVDVIGVLDNKILLVKRNEKIVEGNKWALPGGYLNRDETIEMCALRELHEETGWQGSIKELFIVSASPTRKNDPKKSQNITFTYRVDLIKKTGESDWESSDVRFFSLDELPSINQIAFDHDELISLYVSHLNSPKRIPIIR